MEPWVKLLTHTSDYKAFQNKTVVDILDEVLAEYPYPVEKRLVESYPVRTWQVQYGETDFDFLQRLMQEWGIYWWFEHSEDSHTLVLADAISAHKACPDSPLVEWHQEGLKLDKEFIHTITANESLRTGQWVLDDFDFTKPRSLLANTVANPRETGHATYEHYEWPGDYFDKSEGEMLTRIRMEAQRSPGSRVLGGGNSGRHPQSVHASMTCQTSMNASLSVPVGNWYALLGYSTSRTEGRPVYRGYDDNSDKENVFWRQAYIPASHRESAQASATYSLNMAGMNINTHGGVWRTRNNGVNDDGLFMSVSVSYASQPPTMTGSNGYTSAGTDIHSSRNQKTQTSWNVNHVRSWQQDLYRELSVGFSGYNDDSWSGSLGGRMSGRMGELSATISNSHQRNAGSASSLTAGYSSSLALSRNGLFWGGGQDGEPASGMAVNVESEGDEGSSGKVVSVRGSSQPFSLGFGQQSLLLMEGYNATEVTIEDAGVSSQGMAGVKAGGGSRRYFLTPGHLLVHNISASMSRLYVGRVLDKDGRPLLDAQPLNHPFLSLGPSGRFSLQSEHKESSLWLLSKNRILRCPMSVHKRRDVMQVVGDVRCELSDVDALPQALQISPRVIRLLNVAGLLRHAVQEA